MTQARSKWGRIGKLGPEDDTKEHIPVALRYMPWWIRETWREHKRTAPRPIGRFDPKKIANYLVPNLKRPVFIIGAPRSGTTFLGNCLSQLPEVVYFFEPPLTKGAVHHIYLRDWSEWRAALLYRSAYSWLMRVRHEPEKTFCEKTPGNCFIIPFLHRTFPGAIFIHILRDGRDSALSLAKKDWYANESEGKWLRDPDGYLFGPGRRFWVESDRIAEYESTTNLHRCVWLWRRYVESALDGLAGVPDDQVYQLRYEDLLAGTDEYGGAILDRLNITEPDSRTHFLDHLRSTAHTDSIGAWRSGLSSEEAERLWGEAGALMARLGYARD